MPGEPGLSLSGVVHGGQQPISGAQVYLFAASTSGYGSASTSLLTTGAGKDANNNYYVNTDINGNFTLTGDYTCTSGAQVYLVASGGNPGLTAGTNNTAAKLVDALGTCPSNGTFYGAIPQITVDEITTVAAAWALSAFAVDTLHIGTSSTNTAGLANAFATAMQMVNSYYGYPYTTTPTVTGYTGGLSGNGTVPFTKILTMSNVLAACVNSTGIGGSCSSLFGYAPSTASVTPTDVFTAAVNIAQHPGTNVAHIFNLINTNAAFVPSLTSAPNDWTFSIAYTAPGSSTPTRAAIDASGDLWFGNYGNNSLTEMNPQGVVLSGTAGFTGSNLSAPWGVAVNPSNSYVYAGNNAGNNVSSFTSTGTASIAYSFGIALGNTINFYQPAITSTGTRYLGSSAGVETIGAVLGYITNYAASGLTYGVAINSAGTPVAASYANNTLYIGTTSYSGGALSSPTAIAADHSNNYWITNSTTNSLSEFNSAGTAVTSSGYTGGGLSAPWGISIDGLGNSFVANSNGTISAFTSAGVAMSPSTGYTTASTGTFYSAVIDASGNVWAPNTDGTVYKFVGLAAPVATPLNNTTLGVRP